MLFLIGWARRPTLLGAKLDECRACGTVGPHLILRRTHWFTIFRMPVLLLWVAHGIVCARCDDYQSVGFLRAWRALRRGRLAIDRPRPNFEALKKAFHRDMTADQARAFGVAASGGAEGVKARWRELAKQPEPILGGVEGSQADLRQRYEDITAKWAGAAAPPDATDVFEPVIKNPKRGFFDAYLKLWPIAAALVIGLNVAFPRSPSSSSPNRPVGATGTAHVCWFTGETLNGCRDDEGSSMIFGTQAGTTTVCYFVEPLLAGQTATCTD